MNLYMNLNLKTPSHVTILIWVKKLGIHSLNTSKRVADDWIVFIDESIEFGNDKLLLILGIRETEIDFSKPLSYDDMTCLKLLVSNSWKGQQIKDVLDQITDEVGKIKYAVADMGNAIKKALQLALIPHVHDINHKLSWFIKELLQKDKDFEDYSKILAHLRGSFPLSKMAYILPPQQRINSRYMNLKPIFNWGVSVLKLIENGNLDPIESQKLFLIKKHEKLIYQMDQLIQLANKTQEIIKTQGLSNETKNKCLALYDKHHDERILKFKGMLKQYLTHTLAMINDSSSVLCSSDIIESSFGKYKNFISKNKSVGITDLALTIPAFVGKKDEQIIKNALESTKVEDINQWTKNNIGESLTTKRRKALKPERKKVISIQ